MKRRRPIHTAQYTDSTFEYWWNAIWCICAFLNDTLIRSEAKNELKKVFNLIKFAHHPHTHTHTWAMRRHIHLVMRLAQLARLPKWSEYFANFLSDSVSVSIHDQYMMGYFQSRSIQIPTILNLCFLSLSSPALSPPPLSLYHLHTYELSCF